MATDAPPGRCRTLDGMTNTMTNPNNSDPQRRRHRHPLRHARRRQGRQRDRRVPVPGHQPVGERHPQPLDDRGLLRRQAGDGARPAAGPPRRPPGGARRRRPRPDAGRVRAARPGRLPDGRHRQHRRGARRRPRRGVLHRRGRHRPARHPRPVRRGPQRLPADPGLVHVKGDDAEKLRQVVDQSRKRSAVYDILTNGVPVSIEVGAG